ncbi:MAG: hypothetical protein IJA67_02660 [Oscillospiraceae bacterium]|nr:hypothetical protein [Oscillospiraceae bacterium]
MKNRILSFTLALVMMLTMLPVLETEAKAASYDANAAVAYAAAHALDTPEISEEQIVQTLYPSV